MFRSILSILVFLSGLIFMYGGYNLLDVTPPLPIGLCMMGLGMYVAGLGPIMVWLVRR